jgi:hypothetical protein
LGLGQLDRTLEILRTQAVAVEHVLDVDARVDARVLDGLFGADVQLDLVERRALLAQDRDDVAGRAAGKREQDQFLRARARGAAAEVLGAILGVTCRLRGFPRPRSRARDGGEGVASPRLLRDVTLQS